jgi:RNA polymerase sigma-70 factor (ECF subfamily)
MNDEHTRARFETLMLPLMNDAYNLARWLMRNQEDAEDMVQESCLRAFRFFASFHEGTNCRAWFLQIVRNTCYTSNSAALSDSRMQSAFDFSRTNCGRIATCSLLLEMGS